MTSGGRPAGPRTTLEEDKMDKKKTQERRPYQAPVLAKQQNLKEITLFTNFGPGKD